MTLKEAKLMLVKGEKITHRFFSDDEYIKIENGKLIDENGNILDYTEFWKYRSNQSFQTDWEIIKE